MADFKESLQAGLDAAARAANNKKEIRRVIKSVSQEISNISNQKATLGIYNFADEKPENTPLAYMALAAQALSNVKRASHKGLGVGDSDGSNGIEIARWSESENGYPCKITFAGQDIYCNNKDELEGAFLDLLREISTGEAIIRKMKNPDPEQKT